MLLHDTVNITSVASHCSSESELIMYNNQYYNHNTNNHSVILNSTFSPQPPQQQQQPTTHQLQQQHTTPTLMTNHASALPINTLTTQPQENDYLYHVQKMNDSFNSDEVEGDNTVSGVCVLVRILMLHLVYHLNVVC